MRVIFGKHLPLLSASSIASAIKIHRKVVGRPETTNRQIDAHTSCTAFLFRTSLSCECNTLPHKATAVCFENSQADACDTGLWWKLEDGISDQVLLISMSPLFFFFFTQRGASCRSLRTFCHRSHHHRLINIP